MLQKKKSVIRGKKQEVGGVGVLRSGTIRNIKSDQKSYLPFALVKIPGLLQLLTALRGSHMFTFYLSIDQ